MKTVKGKNKTNRRAGDIVTYLQSFFYDDMSYEQEIKELLFEAGKEGLSAKKIARHIFNKHNGLFETTPYDEVYKAVQYCIAKNNKSAKPFIEKAERWGYYKLTEKSSHDTQLLLQFKEGYNEEQEAENGKDDHVCEDLSLSLF